MILNCEFRGHDLAAVSDLAVLAERFPRRAQKNQANWHLKALEPVAEHKIPDRNYDNNNF
jgi:hypothetical protein